MKTAQYIVDLLRGQDEVKVTGLGTFTKVRQAGTFDQKNNVFYPPSYKISFNTDESGDSSLIQYIILKENISQDLAEESVQLFSKEVLNTTQNESFYEIKNLGRFLKRDEKLYFESAEQFGLNENAFELNPIHDIINKEISSIPKEERIELVTQIEETKSSSDILQEEANNENLDEETSEENTYSRSWLKIFIFFIIFLSSLIALFYLNEDFNNFVKNKSAGLFHPVKNTPMEDSLAIDSTKINADSLDFAVDSASIIADSIQQTKDTILTQSTGSKTITNNNLETFEIISAAFTKKSEAEAYMKELSNKGIQSKVVENMPGKMLKISLGTFLDEESAKTELRRIHKEINKDAWIAHLKPN
jgi:nucleoid DNA-binding protein